MFVGLFIAGGLTGAAITMGGKKLIRLVRDIRQKEKEIKELKDEVRELKDQIRDRNL